MTPAEVASKLRQFNEWRRGDYEPSEQPEQPNPYEVGLAIDAAVEMIDRLEAAESDALAQARMNGMGASREAALMAKLEAAEKERDNANAAAAGIALQAETLQAERDALLARIEAMEKQEPIAWMDRNGTLYNTVSHVRASDKPLYLAPGAQPAPSALAEAIIADMQAQHDSELITENDSGEALIRLDGAIAAVEDNFALAQPAPIIPEGWKLVPIEPTPEMIDAAEYVDWGDADVRGSCINAWDRMLAAAPEAKPCP